jgi:hypothetical protein
MNHRHLVCDILSCDYDKLYGTFYDNAERLAVLHSADDELNRTPA